MKKLLVVLGALAFVTLVAAPVGAGDVASYTVDLEGGQEVPAGAGDPDGTGTVTLQLGTVSNEVCVTELTTADIDTPVGFHIHRGPAGVNGPIVVDLVPALSGLPYCTIIDVALMAELITTPEQFYLNIHTGQFPAGAIRGQLPGGAPPPTSETTASTATTSTTAGASGAATSPTFTG